MEYGKIDEEYSLAEKNYNQAKEIIDNDESQARNLLIQARDRLSNCKDPRAKQLAKDVQHELDQLRG
jgi:hypothetical protein